MRGSRTFVNIIAILVFSMLSTCKTLGDRDSGLLQEEGSGSKANDEATRAATELVEKETAKLLFDTVEATNEGEVDLKDMGLLQEVYERRKQIFRSLAYAIPAGAATWYGFYYLRESSQRYDAQFQVIRNFIQGCSDLIAKSGAQITKSARPYSNRFIDSSARFNQMVLPIINASVDNSQNSLRSFSTFLAQRSTESSTALRNLSLELTKAIQTIMVNSSNRSAESFNNIQQFVLAQLRSSVHNSHQASMQVINFLYPYVLESYHSSKKLVETLSTALANSSNASIRESRKLSTLVSQLSKDAVLSSTEFSGRVWDAVYPILNKSSEKSSAAVEAIFRALQTSTNWSSKNSSLAVEYVRNALAESSLWSSGQVEAMVRAITPHIQWSMQQSSALSTQIKNALVRAGTWSSNTSLEVGRIIFNWSVQSSNAVDRLAKFVAPYLQYSSNKSAEVISQLFKAVADSSIWSANTAREISVQLNKILVKWVQSSQESITRAFNASLAFSERSSQEIQKIYMAIRESVESSAMRSSQAAEKVSQIVSPYVRFSSEKLQQFVVQMIRSGEILSTNSSAAIEYVRNQLAASAQTSSRVSVDVATRVYNVLMPIAQQALRITNQAFQTFLTAVEKGSAASAEFSTNVANAVSQAIRAAFNSSVESSNRVAAFIGPILQQSAEVVSTAVSNIMKASTASSEKVSAFTAEWVKYSFNIVSEVYKYIVTRSYNSSVASLNSFRAASNQISALIGRIGAFSADVARFSATQIATIFGPAFRYSINASYKVGNVLMQNVSRPVSGAISQPWVGYSSIAAVLLGAVSSSIYDIATDGKGQKYLKEQIRSIIGKEPALEEHLSKAVKDHAFIYSLPPEAQSEVKGSLKNALLESAVESNFDPSNMEIDLAKTLNPHLSQSQFVLTDALQSSVKYLNLNTKLEDRTDRVAFFQKLDSYLSLSIVMEHVLKKGKVKDPQKRSRYKAALDRVKNVIAEVDAKFVFEKL